MIRSFRNKALAFEFENGDALRVDLEQYH